MIYVPSDYVNSPCFVINNGYIRAYTNSQLTRYVDIYVNQNYMVKTGESVYAYNGVCDNTNTFTDNYIYRNDFDKILIIALIMIGVSWFLISKLVKTFFRGFKKF